MKHTYQTNGIDENLPLIYRIGIGSRLFYIGCADCAKRPKKDYVRNVTRMLAGKPYRKSNPNGFRLIHQKLFEAFNNGDEIVIELLKNVPADKKFEEERQEISIHRQLHGEQLLNGTDSRQKLIKSQ